MGKKRAVKLAQKKKLVRTPGEELQYFKEKSKAMQIEQKNKPKSHKVKKMLEKKESILQNDPKHTVFMRGNNCSQVTQDAMKELHKMRDLNISKCLMQKKNEIYPFEDVSRLERVADRHDAAFVIFGSHNKERQHNMIFNRMFNHQVLDMIEVGVDSCTTMQTFGNIESIEIGQQPILIFQGEVFDLSQNHIRFKNMMLDLFRIKHLRNINILIAQRIIVFTAKTMDGSILMQQFESGKINEGLAGEGKIETKEIGPKIGMTIRRVRHPDNDAWKAATKVFKSKKRALDKKRNISKNELGQTIGKAFIQHQDLGTLALKKVKRKKTVEGQESGGDQDTGVEQADE